MAGARKVGGAMVQSDELAVMRLEMANMRGGEYVLD